MNSTGRNFDYLPPIKEKFYPTKLTAQVLLPPTPHALPMNGRLNLFPKETLNLSIMGSSAQHDDDDATGSNGCEKSVKRKRNSECGVKSIKKMSSAYVGCHWHHGAGMYFIFFCRRSSEKCRWEMLFLFN
jgi:hypothetical protein